MTKRKISTRIILDGVVDSTFTQLRQVYTDDVGEYVNCNRNKYHIVGDSFDLVCTTGRAITFTELADKFKETFGVKE